MKIISQYYIAKRRSAIKNSTGSFTKQEWRELLEKYGDKCLCCGSKEKITLDHITPLSKGGSNSIDNIQPLCSVCNRKKWKDIIDYRK